MEPDEAIFRENTRRFADATGVPVRVDFSGWEDLRPQTAVTTNTGAGPDVVVGWTDDPHLYADKLLDLTDIAEYLGQKYGGWHPLAERYGKKFGTNQWIAIPMGASGGPMVYRESWVKEAGFDTFPDKTDALSRPVPQAQGGGPPGGLRAGARAGGRQRLARSQQHKAMLAGELGCTQNGVSLYHSAKNSPDPKIAAAGADMNHALMPVGPAGVVTQGALAINAMAFRHGKHPNAARAYLAYMMEAPQYDPWLSGSFGYWGQPLRAFENSAVWTGGDPKVRLYKDTMAASR